MNKQLLIIESDIKNGESVSNHFKKKNWQVNIVDSLALVKDHLADDDFCPDVILANLGVSADEMFKNTSELEKLTNFSEWIFTHDPENTFLLSTMTMTMMRTMLPFTYPNIHRLDMR